MSLGFRGLREIGFKLGFKVRRDRFSGRAGL